MLKKFICLFLSFVILNSISIRSSFAGTDSINGETILNSVSSPQNHPRLWVNKEDIAKQVAAINHDEFKQNELTKLRARCDWYITTEPIVYKVASDNKAFGPCLTARNYLIDLCTMYLLTGEKKYADRAWAELVNVLSGDWYNYTWNMVSRNDIEGHSHHRLDSGKLFVGVAFAYDALYDDYLTKEQKEFVRTKIEKYVDNCSSTNFGSADGAKYGWSNWAAVEGTAMLMTALSFYGDDADFELKLDDKLEALASKASELLYRISSRVPSDGSWSEGFGYHEYMMEHLAWASASLTNSCGTDFGLMAAGGIGKMGEYAMRNCTQNGMYNFSSTNGHDNMTQFAPETMLIAELCGNDNDKALYNNHYKNMDIDVKYSARYLMFAPLDTEFGIKTPRLDSISQDSGYSSITGLWNNPDRFNLAVNGGKAMQYSNNHFDKGSFILENMGERWIMDLGRSLSWIDDYLGYSCFHNVLVAKSDGDFLKDQVIDTSAYPVKHSLSEKEAYVIYDLKDVYSGVMDSYKRGFFAGDGRTTLTVRDELSLSSAKDLEWNFLTKADVTVSGDKKSAILTIGDKKMYVTADCSIDGWYFDTAAVASKVDSSLIDNETAVSSIKTFVAKTNMLTLYATGSGDINMSIRFAPEINSNSSYPALSDTLDEWKAKDSDKLYVSEFEFKHSDISKSNELFIEAENFDIKDKYVQIIIAHYYGTELKHISNLSVNTIFSDSKTAFKEIIPYYNDSDSIKVFAFDSIRDIKPLNKHGQLMNWDNEF